MLLHPKAYGCIRFREPINKYDLCICSKKVLSVEILPDDSLSRSSLDSNRFRKVFDYEPPSWEEMIDELNNY